LETLKKTKSVENSHVEMELNNLKERVNRYQIENEDLGENIQKTMEKSE